MTEGLAMRHVVATQDIAAGEVSVLLVLVLPLLPAGTSPGAAHSLCTAGPPPHLSLLYMSETCCGWPGLWLLLSGHTLLLLLLLLLILLILLLLLLLHLLTLLLGSVLLPRVQGPGHLLLPRPRVWPGGGGHQPGAPGSCSQVV